MRRLLLGVALLTSIGLGVSLFTETFDAPGWSPNAPPAGWRIYPADSGQSRFDDWHRDSARAPWGGHPTPFAAISFTALADPPPDSLISPMIDCRGMENVALICSTYFWRWSSNPYVARLVYSIDGGQTFPYVLHDYYLSSVNQAVRESLPMPAATNRESVVVAWVFDGNLAYINCWFVDNVEVVADSIVRWDVACTGIIAPPSSMLPGQLTPVVRFRNLGLNDYDTVFAACSLYDDAMNGLAYWEDTIYNLAAGAAERETVFEPPFPVTIGDYFFKVWCWAESNFVTTNDTLTRNFRVTNTRTLRYDDGTAASFESWPVGHYGWGVKFDPDTFPVYFESLSVYLQAPANPAHCGYQLAIFEDDGTGRPGEMLYISPVQYAPPGSTGWQSVFMADSGEKIVRQAGSGSFYLFYLQVGEPPESPAIGRDAGRSPGAAYWQYRNGTFVPDAANGDYMLRAVMNLEPVVPPLFDVRTIALLAPEYDFIQRPFDRPIVPRGRFENFGTTTVYSVAAQCDIVDPTGAVMVYSQLVVIDSLRPGQDTVIVFPGRVLDVAGRCSVRLWSWHLGAPQDSIPENDDKRYACDIIRGQHTGTSALGYAWIDSDTAGGPTFEWFDTTRMSGSIALGRQGRINIPTGFDFPYYDSLYNYVYVSANGWMGVGVSNPGGTDDSLPRPLPNSVLPNRSLYVYWDDLGGRPDFSRGKVWYGYGGVAPNRYCVILWKDMIRERSQDTTNPISFEVVITENGLFKFQYLDVDCGDLRYNRGRCASIGLENSGGTDGLNYLYAMPPMSAATNDPGNRLDSGRAILFYQLVTDAAARRIVEPSGYSFPGTIIPKVMVQNYGTTRNPIRVFLRIGTAYAADTVIPGLGPGESTLVSFVTRPWPADIGTFTAVCSVYVANDVDSTNDVVSATIRISSWANRENIPPGLNRKKVKSGSLVYVPNEAAVYALKGSNTNEFWRFDVTTGQWDTLPPMPMLPSGFRAKDGCDLAYDGDRGRIWAIKAGGRTDFYYYDIATRTWHTSPEIRQPIINDGRPYFPPKRGAALAYVSPGPFGAGPQGSVYLMPGNGTNYLWRYDIQRDSWNTIVGGSGVLDIPSDPLRRRTVRVAGDLAYDGDSILYVMKGSNTTEFYGLDLRLNVWSESLDQTTLIGPTNRRVKAGGAMAYHNGYLYALKGGNTLEFWRYDFAGDSWFRRTDIPYSPTGPRVKVKRGAALAAAETTLFCLKGSYGYEFWEYKPAGDTASGFRFSGRPEREGVQAGSAEDLTQPWLTVRPNPTRAGIVLSYNLPSPANVRVRIHDAAGRLVTSLVDGPRLSGRHHVSWDGRGRDRQAVAAGVYFAVFEFGDVRLSRKLVIER